VSTPHRNLKTGKRDFALMITAEPLVVVPRPSDLVVFFSSTPAGKDVKPTGFTYGGLATREGLVKRENESIAGMTYKPDKQNPLEFIQAEKAVELLDRFEGHGSTAIVENRGPRVEQRRLADRVAGESTAGGKQELELMDRGVTDAVDFPEPILRCAENLREAAETGQQGFGDRFGVAARKALEQDQFEQFVILEGVGSVLAEPRLQPFAVSVKMRGRVAVARAIHCGVAGMPSCSPGDRVNISTPVSVTPTECSN